MTTQYWLQKKPFNSWQHVTWYATLEEAKSNFDKMSESSGYSWRLVKAEVLEELLLEGERPEMKVDEETLEPVAGEFKSSWGSSGASGWGKPLSDNPSSVKIKNSEDGRGARAGSICLIHRADKKRTRCMPDELNAMIAQGWERGGPRTVL